MRTAFFHGSLAADFGPRHQFDAPTTFLLTQGLILQLGEKFKQAIGGGKWHIVLGKPDRKKTNAISNEQVHQQLGNVEEVHFYPVVEGKSAAVRVVIGVVLIAVAYFVPGPWSPYLYKMGAIMILGGVVEMLAKKPSIPTDGGSSNPNYFFKNGVNTMEQGGPRPLVYGRVRRAGSQVISQGIAVEQLT